MRDIDPLRKLMRTRLPLNEATNPHWVNMTRIMARWANEYPGWTVAHISEVSGISEVDVRRGLAEARAYEVANAMRLKMIPTQEQAMPPVSSSQRKLMRAAAASPTVRKRTGVSKKVAQEFNRADPGGKLPAKVKKPRK